MTDPTQDRVKAVMHWFKKQELDAGDPKWSSRLLDRFFEEALSAPGGSLQDIYQGLDAVLANCRVELTPAVANLIKDVVVQGFTRHRSSYDAMGWDWANAALCQEASAARCYFFLHALPPQAADPQSIVTIHRELQGTPYQQEAEQVLSDDLERPEIQRLAAAK